MEHKMTEFAGIRGSRIAYEVSGSGAPLLLLHGAEGSRRSFDRLVLELERDFTVIRYDQRDCGETENPAVSASLSTLADDAQSLLTWLGHSSAFVFGTSFGGRVAQALAVRHPRAVVQLALASTWALSHSLQELNPTVAAETMSLRAQLPESAEKLAEYFFPPAFLLENPSFKRHFESATPRNDRSDRRSDTVRDVPALDISEISVPTLLIAGEMDRLIPPELTQKISLHIRHARLIVLAGVGHISIIQAPAELGLHLRSFFYPTESSAS